MSFDASNSQDTVTSLGGRLVDLDISADELALDYPSAVSRTKRQKKEEEARQAPSTAPIEVQIQHTLVGNTRGRQLSVTGQKMFIPRSWLENPSTEMDERLFSTLTRMSVPSPRATSCVRYEKSHVRCEKSHVRRGKSHIRGGNMSFYQKGSVKMLSRNTSFAIMGVLQWSPR
jgi:hypothetical protein